MQVIHLCIHKDHVKIRSRIGPTFFIQFHGENRNFRFLILFFYSKENRIENSPDAEHKHRPEIISRFNICALCRVCVCVCRGPSTRYGTAYGTTTNDVVIRIA